MSVSKNQRLRNLVDYSKEIWKELCAIFSTLCIQFIIRNVVASFAQTCVGSMVDCHDHHGFKPSFIIERNVTVIFVI